MDIHLRRVAFRVGESDFVALLHQSANRDRQLVEVEASAGINLAIFQGQAVTARDQYQDFSFCCHFVLLFEIESVLLKYGTETGDVKLGTEGTFTDSHSLKLGNVPSVPTVSCPRFPPKWARTGHRR